MHNANNFFWAAFALETFAIKRVASILVSKALCILCRAMHNAAFCRAATVSAQPSGWHYLI